MCIAGEVIPPNASLTFEVELLSIKDGQPPSNIFKEIDTDQNDLLSREEVQWILKSLSLILLQNYRIYHARQIQFESF